MIAYHKSAPLTSSLLLLPLPLSFTQHTTCALEGTLNTTHKYLLVTCYLPQDHADHANHAKACSALTTPPLIYLDHLIILVGDFHGNLTSPSDKTFHLRTLPYSRLQGPTLPTFTPTYQPEQATCIDHFCIYDTLNTTTQTHDTQNITHAFLDHDGVKATIRIPLLRSSPPTGRPTTTNQEHAHTIRFQFSNPQPLLSQ